MKAEHPVTLALTSFVEDYLAVHPTLTIARDPLWPSPCETDAALGKGLVHWRPQRRYDAKDFSGVESALGCTLHEDIKHYYGSFWSGTLEAEAAEGHVSLLFIWNPEDVDRLAENFIGHALQQKKHRTPLTWFFACTEPDSEYFLSVDQASGAILLETPGSPPVRQVADNLSSFIARLKPAKSAEQPANDLIEADDSNAADH